MNYVIHPLEGVNEIRFGMHASEVRALMGSTPREFRRHTEIYPSDYYVSEGVFCYYDPDGHLEAMEFDRIAPVFLNGVDLFKLRLGQMIALFTQLDPMTVRDEPGGAMSHALSLALLAPDDDDEGEDAPVEVVLAGRPGYYDSPDAADGAIPN